ncbi:hypothetical protein RT97_22980 [Variovorax paradoxus]|uniref:DUF5666 domain-containing protein n=1 Tax=Variovorax paradoxus TaxID=34073 RepID=A0A0D0M189_VARPD|nr:DUF5666 domain-containing protein [Variovorax paradoxus]KIQ26126.1 hypothetical protein RT97_22980 [Variovorax paradoxus]
MSTTKTPRRVMLGLIAAGFMALLLSCGGGGGGGSTAGFGAGIAAGAGAGGVNGTGNSGGDGANSGTSAGIGTGAGADGSADGSGSTAGNGGTDSSGVGSGGTAGNGNTDGVGSGGTGVTADAAGIGAADGLGSIILNGLRYDTDSATINVEDAAELQIGMSARVAGKVDANFTSGIATQVVSAAELRGAVSHIDLGAGSFVVMGIGVSIDNATVWADASGLASMVDGSLVQVWGLPGAPGTLRATRVQVAPSLTAPLVTGAVRNLDAANKTFTLGQLTVEYGAASFAGIDTTSLVNGVIVRARGTTAPAAGRFKATKVEGWYAIPLSDGFAVQLAGVITDFASRGAFEVLGTPVDATSSLINGGPASSLGNGVKVEVDGFMSGGVLVAKKLRIRNVPGTGGPASFTLIGAIGAFHSAADFRVRGQPVDASGPGTVFENGTIANLGNGQRVTVVGDRVLDGVLIAQRVTFSP